MAVIEGALRKAQSYVAGPNGDVLTIENLPLPGFTRWVPRRKAEIVAAVCGGLLSLGEACERYRLSPEEFRAWQDALDQFGLAGLRATKSRGHVGIEPH